MIWQNPWAWLGLAAVAIPILIHLLGRDKAPRRSFPSLRFIEIAELPPTRRTRLHDLLLLATRVAIFVIACAALAQPLLLLASRRAAIDREIARAVIVDTSASMLRLATNGVRALDSARAEAKHLAGDARTSILIETSSPASAIEGAVAWLESQPSRREIAVISDFQIGAIDSVTVAGVPSAIGVRAIPIPTADRSALQRQSRVGDASLVTHIDVGGDRTVALWLLDSARSSAVRAEPKITIDAPDRSAADASMSAAKTLSIATPIDTTVLVSVVFRGAADRDALMNRATRVSAPSLIDLLARLHADPLFPSKPGLVAEDTAGGARRLLVFSDDSVATVRSAMLVAAVRRALSAAPPVSELDPSTIPSSVIASWQRAPSATPTHEMVDSTSGPSDARWLWLIVLVLLGVEAWLRRDRPATTVRIEESAHDRAA